MGDKRDVIVRGQEILPLEIACANGEIWCAQCLLVSLHDLLPYKCKFVCRIYDYVEVSPSVILIVGFRQP